MESYACTLKIFMFVLCKAEGEGRYEVEELKERQLITVLISLGICSTPKLSK